MAKTEWKKGVKMVELWHCSPNHLTGLVSRSRFWGKAGLYFSPSYTSLISDWLPVVMWRKGKKHPLRQMLNSAWEKIQEIEKNEHATEKEKNELARLETLLDRYRSQWPKEVSYSKVFLHRILCPEDIYKKSKDHFWSAYTQDYHKDSFGFWGWGDQIFVLEEDLSKLEIVKVQSMNQAGFLKENENLRRSNYYRNFHFFKNEDKKYAEAQAKKTL